MAPARTIDSETLSSKSPSNGTASTKLTVHHNGIAFAGKAIVIISMGNFGLQNAHIFRGVFGAPVFAYKA
jgi:lactate dehydrogenase-like 2-hydroxyacid dehydrogenase